MGHIAIRLNPAELTNPDLDIRYRIPDLISEATSGRVKDDGYDYTDGNILVVYLTCDHPNTDVMEVIETLRTNKVCENQILDSAVIGVSTNAYSFSIVHPNTGLGEFAVRPW